MTNKHKVKELAFDLQQAYYKAFQEHLMTEPLSLKTLGCFLHEAEGEIFCLEDSKIAKTVFYKVHPSNLRDFLQKHQGLSDYEQRDYVQRTPTLSIKSVVEGDSVIRVMLCSSTPQLDDLTLVMLDAALEFMPARKRFSQVTLEKLSAAGYKSIIPTLWTKSFYSQSEVGKFEDYRISFDLINNTFFQARVCFDSSSGSKSDWVNHYADTIEELEEKVRHLYLTSSYRTPSQLYVKSWENKLLLLDE
jgi:hypothetical protein